MQERHQLAAAGWLDAFEQIEERHEMSRAAARRNFGDDTVGDTSEADGVALLDGQVSQAACDALGVINLLGAAGTKSHRAAGVDHEAEAEICIGFGFLDVVAIGATEGAPI